MPTTQAGTFSAEWLRSTMRFAIWLSVGLGVCGCGPSGPAAGATEVGAAELVAPPPQPPASASAAVTAAAALESDGCLVVAEPYQLDFPKEKLERNRKRREAEEAERIRPNPCPEEDRSEEPLLPGARALRS